MQVNEIGHFSSQVGAGGIDDVVERVEANRQRAPLNCPIVRCQQSRGPQHQKSRGEVADAKSPNTEQEHAKTRRKRAQRRPQPWFARAGLRSSRTTKKSSTATSPGTPANSSAGRIPTATSSPEARSGPPIAPIESIARSKPKARP